MSSQLKSNYITPEGEVTLRTELRQLWRHERPEWTQRVSDAAKEGDRSENAEYIYSKKKLRELDRRIRYLTKRLEAIQVVNRIPEDQSRAYFGAWLELLHDNQICLFRLVGTDEFDQHENYLSIDSPLARQLIGKTKGDSIELKVADHHLHYEIINVYYK